MPFGGGGGMREAPGPRMGSPLGGPRWWNPEVETAASDGKIGARRCLEKMARAFGRALRPRAILLSPKFLWLVYNNILYRNGGARAARALGAAPSYPSALPSCRRWSPER